MTDMELKRDHPEVVLKATVGVVAAILVRAGLATGDEIVDSALQTARELLGESGQ